MDFVQQYPIVSTLIFANLAASVGAFQSRSFYEQNLFAVGLILQAQQWHRVVTSGFLHVNLAHLVLNMLALYNFGPFLERQLGHTNFCLIYFLALAGGSLWSLMEHRREAHYTAVGASGAVSGVIVGFCLFWPFAMLEILFIPMPAFGFAILFIGASAYLSTRRNTVIGHDAHLGGALVGAVVTVLSEPTAWVRFITEIERVTGL